jgi:tripartite-type tricarboxylate transporter receptor subunit TctC
VAGQIDLVFANADTLPLVRAGSIKAYATTSDARSAVAPDIPTFGEMGLPELAFSTWWTLFAPKRTPKQIIDRLNAATAQALADLAVQSRLANLGGEIFPRDRQTPEALGALVKAGEEKWWPLIKLFGSRRSEVSACPVVPIVGHYGGGKGNEPHALMRFQISRRPISKLGLKPRTN